MRGVGRGVKIIVGLAFVLAHCLGCTTPGSVGNAPQADVQTGAQQTAGGISAPVDIPASAEAVQIQAVQIQEKNDQTVVRVVGNGPLKDYNFQRVGENQFSLELNDVKHQSTRPPLPSPTALVKLAYADEPSSNGLCLMGTLTNPLDHYFLNNLGNELVLSLYSSTQSPRSAPKKSVVTPKASVVQARAVTLPGYAQPPSMHQVLTPSNMPAPPMILNKHYTGKPISLDLLDADLRNVLRLLADIAAINLVVEPDVTGKVTLKVDQVPWDQVLDIVLSMNDLGKQEMGNVVRIATQAKIKQEWTAQEDEIKAKQKLLEAVKDSGEIRTEYLTVNYAQPDAIAAKINEIKSDKGKLSVDPRTSLIIFTDYPARIMNARELLAKLDKPTPQVMIEARIVQMNINASRELGVRWKFHLDHFAGGDQTNVDFQVNHLTAGDLFGFSFGNIVGRTLWQIDLDLSALEETGQSKVISAPRVLTMDHVKAVISQGTEIPYLKIDPQAIVASTEFKEAVLELSVTPHITPDRKIRLQIQATKDSPDFGNLVNGQPPIDTRKIDTELLVADGSTIVIGGILENDDSINVDGTPGLNQVPILGRLFKSETVRHTKRELLIFISPKIVEAGPAVSG